MVILVRYLEKGLDQWGDCDCPYIEMPYLFSLEYPEGKPSETNLRETKASFGLYHMDHILASHRPSLNPGNCMAKDSILVSCVYAYCAKCCTRMQAKQLLDTRFAIALAVDLCNHSPPPKIPLWNVRCPIDHHHGHFWLILSSQQTVVREVRFLWCLAQGSQLYWNHPVVLSSTCACLFSESLPALWHLLS
jgi:hypothetical protein